MPGAVHLFEDVASLPELAQTPLPVLGQHPAARRDVLGGAKTFEVLEPEDKERRLPTPATLGQRPEVDAAVGRDALDLAVE